jgi:hypothetical protein
MTIFMFGAALVKKCYIWTEEVFKCSVPDTEHFGLDRILTFRVMDLDQNIVK